MTVNLKLNHKIAFTMVILMIVPIIITILSDRSYMDKISTSACTSYNDSAAETASSVFSYMFENIIGDIKSYTSDNSVKTYADLCRYGFGGDKKYTDEYQAAYKALKQYNRREGLLDCFLVNIQDIVILSDNEDELGETWLSPVDFDDATGISNMFMYGNEAKKSAFICRKDVFTIKNEYAGTLYAVYSTDTIRKALKCVNIDKYTDIAAVDAKGNIFHDNYISTLNFKSSNEFDEFSDTIISYNSGKISDPSIEKYNYLGHEKYASFNKTELGGWLIIAMTDYQSMKWNYVQPIILPVIAAVIAAAAIFAFTVYFMHPSKKIIEFLKQKAKGDVSARLDFHSNDDFEEMALRFNLIFDDLMDSELRYRTIVEMQDSIAFEVDFKSQQVNVSNKFDKKFSFRPKNNSIRESFLYKWYVHKDDKVKYFSDLENIMDPKTTEWNGEYMVRNIYGDFTWVLIRAKKLCDRMNNPYKIVGVVSDIDREKENELHLIRKASYDQLTQIYNRDSFLKLLSAEIDNCRNSHELSAVMFIDLDDFKHFNDNYGHNCGDEVLKFTADIIKELSFEHGFGGRFGGDEFIVCLRDLKLIGDAGKSAEELINALGAGFDYNGEHLSVRCSIGIAFFGENGNTSEEIIASADAAMYRIKKHGKSDFAYASADEEKTGPRLIGKPIDSDMKNHNDKDDNKPLELK